MKTVAQNHIFTEKKEETRLTPMAKALTPTGKSKKQSDKTKTPPKTSTTQRPPNELERPVGVTDIYKVFKENKINISDLSIRCI